MRSNGMFKSVNYTPPTPKSGNITELEKEAKEILDQLILAANREATK